MCLASELTSSLLGFLVCVFVSVTALFSQLLLVSFSFSFFSFFSVWPYFPFCFVESFNLCTLGFVYLARENVSTLPFRSPGLLSSAPCSTVLCPSFCTWVQEHGDWWGPNPFIQIFFFFFFKRERKLVREETSSESSSVFRQTPFCKAKWLDLPRCWVIPTLAEIGRGSRELGLWPL